MSANEGRISRRSALRMFKGALGLAAGMSLMSSAAPTAQASTTSAPDEATRRTVRAITAAPAFATLVAELRAAGFDFKAYSETGTFISGTATDAGELRVLFATTLIRTSATAGTLTFITANTSAGVVREQKTVSIQWSCPPGQICTDAIDPGGGCDGCCSGWTQVGYYKCIGLSQYNCVALQRRCCCCDNATICWYEYTGEVCTLFCTVSCYDPNCLRNACGGCA